MVRRHSIAEARDNLPKLVREAEAGKAVELTRRGKSVAYLLGRSEYERLTSGRRPFSVSYAAFLREVDLQALAIDPGAVFGQVRDRTAGRDVSF